MPLSPNPEIAPDCRTGIPFVGVYGYMQPVYCANCGVQGPWVLGEDMTFAFWLCDNKLNGCFEKYGEIAGTMVMPDQVFWEKIKNESIDQYGRELTHMELDIIAAEDSSPLATLIKEGR